MESFPLPAVDGMTWPGGLRFTYGSLLALEREQGKGIRKLFLAQSDFEIVGLLVTYGLRAASPKITLPQATNLIDKYLENGGTLNEIYRVALEALNGSGILRGLNGSPAEPEDESFLAAETTPDKSVN